MSAQVHADDPPAGELVGDAVHRPAGHSQAMEQDHIRTGALVVLRCEPDRSVRDTYLRARSCSHRQNCVVGPKRRKQVQLSTYAKLRRRYAPS